MLHVFVAFCDIPLIQCTLHSKCFIFPLTIAAPTTLLLCSSISEDAPPSLLVFIKRGTYSCHLLLQPILVPGSYFFSKSLLISLNHPAHSGITCPQRKGDYTASNGPLMPLSPSPTTSAANFTSSVLNFQLYNLTMILLLFYPQAQLWCCCACIWTCMLWMS